MSNEDMLLVHIKKCFYNYILFYIFCVLLTVISITSENGCHAVKTLIRQSHSKKR